MSTTDTVIDPRVSGGVYATGGREYRLVYVWSTDDLSIIWAGTDSAVMVENWAWGDSDTVIYSPGLEDLKRLEANLADAVKEAEQITAAAAAASVADVEAVTDSEAGAPGATDTDREAEKEEPTGADVEAGQADTDSEAPAMTGRIGTGKVIHEIQGAAVVGDVAKSWCGKEGLFSKPGATITCKRCQRY